MKDGIAAMLEPHNLPGSGGVITLALLGGRGRALTLGQVQQVVAPLVT